MYTKPDARRAPCSQERGQQRVLVAAGERAAAPAAPEGAQQPASAPLPPAGALPPDTGTRPHTIWEFH